MPRSWKHRSGNDTGCLASYYKGHMMKKYKSVDTPEKGEGWDPLDIRRVGIFCRIEPVSARYPT
jgi:hypothetical protein